MPRNRAPSPQTMKVLGALAADPSRWRHGYELGAETGLKAGSLYPILVRLADRKLLEARWEESPPPGRPARHLYRLTPGGQELAAAAPGASAPAALPAPAAPARAAGGRPGMPPPGGAGWQGARRPPSPAGCWRWQPPPCPRPAATGAGPCPPNWPARDPAASG